MLRTFISAKWWLPSANRILPLWRSSWCPGNTTDCTGEAGNPAHWFQEHADPAVTSTPNRSGKPRLHLSMRINSPGHSTFTAAFCSHTFLIQSCSQLLTNSHSWNLSIIWPWFVFFPLHILQKYVKTPSFAGILPIFHITRWSSHLLFVPFWKAWFLLTCCTRAKKRQDFFSIGLMLFPV